MNVKELNEVLEHLKEAYKLSTQDSVKKLISQAIYHLCFSKDV